MQPQTPHKDRSTPRTVAIVLLGSIVLGLGLGLALCVYRYKPRSGLTPKRLTRLRVLRVLDALLHWKNDIECVRRDGPDPPFGCPASLDELAPEFVESVHLKDAWERPLRFACARDRTCVWSCGPNGRDEQGRGDDLRECYIEEALEGD